MAANCALSWRLVSLGNSRLHKRAPYRERKCADTISTVLVPWAHRRRLPKGNGGDCPRRKTPHTAPPCEELDPATLAVNDTDGNAYDIKLLSVQKITFVLRKINKNCCHQSCTFWLQYAPNRLPAGDSPQTPLGQLTALPQTSSCI